MRQTGVFAVLAVLALLTADVACVRGGGTVFGATGCNDYRIAYEHPITRNGTDRLILADPAITKQQCATSAAVEYVQYFLGTLRDVSYYLAVFANGRMALDTEGGRKPVFSAPE